LFILLGKTACTVVTICNWEWFKEWKDDRVKQRGPDYEVIKQAFGKKMWEQVLMLFPQLADKVTTSPYIFTFDLLHF
jgi:all-trans-retinol 13,14-reductase